MLVVILLESMLPFLLILVVCFINGLKQEDP